MIIYFQETRSNHVLSGLIAFCVLWGEFMRYYIMFGITLILCLIIVFYTPYLGIYRKNVNIKFDFDD